MLSLELKVLIVDWSFYKDSDSCLSFSLLQAMYVTTECPKKRPLGFLGLTGEYFPKLILNCKINFISTSLKKNSILSHKGKKIQARQYFQNYLLQPGMCKKTNKSDYIFKLETQNLNVKSTTETVLRI